MPRVHSYTPAWLSRPSPGFQLFNSTTPTPYGSQRSAKDYGGRSPYLGPTRTIAHRGSEVFVVVGKQIRWADLPSLKDEWSAIEETPTKKPRVKNGAAGEDEDKAQLSSGDGSYRVLKVAIGEPIRQLRISPNEKLMAIITSHTVHIAILPDPELLNAHQNKEPLRLKTYTIGPTTHVLSKSPVASVLWHPLGEEGNCLVTITTDAILRLWEFNVYNRWSADSPTLAIDLKKLVLAESSQDDTKPNESHRNKVFTADAVGMDVAAACFGGQGYGDETPWSALTLWVAMSSGDIYALCPLLPSRFQPHTDLFEQLSNSVIENKARKGDQADDSFESQQYDRQFSWIHDLDSQQPVTKAIDDQSPTVEIYKRPDVLSAVPRLQGPFQLFPDGTIDELEPSDIHVIPAKANSPNDEEELDSQMESTLDRGDDEGISASLVCLVTREGRVYVCLDLESVQGQWLPRKPSPKPQALPPDPLLIVLECMNTLKPGEDYETEWPTITPDLNSRYAFFVTHSHGVYSFLLSPWLENLERELQNDDAAGVHFRLDIFRNNMNSTRERIFSFTQPQDSTTEPVATACLALQDSDLGYFLLTSFNSQPQAATLDIASPGSSAETDLGFEAETLFPHVAYPPYEPLPGFYAPSSLPRFAQNHVPQRHRHLLKEELRLSTATLDIFTEAHRVITKEGHQILLAASNLFNRCELLLEFLENQVVTAFEVAARIDRVAGPRPGIEGEDTAREAMEKRIERARDRQRNLSGRCEELRRRVRGLEGRELTIREKQWVREIEDVGQSVLGNRTHRDTHPNAEDDQDSPPDADKADSGDENDTREDGEVSNEDANSAGAEDEDENENGAEHLRRFKEVQRLTQELLQQAKEFASSHSSSDDDDKSPQSEVDRGGKPNEHVPSALRKKKITEVMKMLEKEEQLVNETHANLERLRLGT